MRQVFMISVIVAWAAMFAAGTAVAEEAKITITKKDCRRLVRHTASADIAYRPGVDVRGRKVVPANAGGRVPLKLPDVFEFNIDVDIRKYLGGRHGGHHRRHQRQRFRNLQHGAHRRQPEGAKIRRPQHDRRQGAL